MSDTDDQDDFITNEDTRRRRAWIERAVRGVRRRLDAGEAIPELPESEPAPPPRLRVVPGGRKS
jgi:hypothetical protein